MSQNERETNIEPRWLALLYIVLCLGAHFGDGSRSEETRLLEVSLSILAKLTRRRVRIVCRLLIS